MLAMQQSDGYGPADASRRLKQRSRLADRIETGLLEDRGALDIVRKPRSYAAVPNARPSRGTVPSYWDAVELEKAAVIGAAYDTPEEMPQSRTTTTAEMP